MIDSSSLWRGSLSWIRVAIMIGGGYFERCGCGCNTRGDMQGECSVIKGMGMAVTSGRRVLGGVLGGVLQSKALLRDLIEPSEELESARRQVVRMRRSNQGDRNVGLV